MDSVLKYYSFFLSIPHPEGIKSSPLPRVLKISRSISTILMLLFLIFYLYIYQAGFFLYFTHWGILLTFLYFCMSLSSFRYARCEIYCCIMLITVWNLEFMITLVFWAAFFVANLAERYEYLVVGVISHGLVLAMIGIDIGLCYGYFKRLWVAVSFIVFIVYSLGLYLPYTITVGPVYKGVTFKNAFTYYIMISACVAILAGNEIAYRLTRRRKFYSII